MTALLRYIDELDGLNARGNLRRIPDSTPAGIVDLSSNDYLGLAEDTALAEEFLAHTPVTPELMTSSASRLLGSRQTAYTRLEATLKHLYGRPALMFNSGYHANVGAISALAAADTLFVVDRLVHASVIDGLRMSSARFERFAHNDTAHLSRILQKKAGDYRTVVIVIESVYSMDGDEAPLAEIAQLKADYPHALLYVDEAHAVGVCGPAGLGCSAALRRPEDVDILVGTLGKALASAGAFVITHGVLRDYLVNRARPLIYSTALPPLQALWSEFLLRKMVDMDHRRTHLAELGRILSHFTGAHPGHIQPLMAGSAQRAIQLSEQLLASGYKVLPIRTPTVPPGTERLRFSLSAAINPDQLVNLLSNRFLRL